jgi:6 kDa early secretory antigenic target
MVQQMVVGFAALQNAERDINKCADNMRGRLDDLAAYLTPLTQSWTGEAAEAYQALMQQWHSAANDLTEALGKIAGIVRTAESNYRSAVTTNKSMWPVR